MIYTFKLQPVPASRPRVTRWGTHYGKTYKAFRLAFKNVLVHMRPKPPRAGKLEVWCDFHVQKARTSKLTIPRGDLDNYVKALWDGCNNVVWLDDNQIVECHATKQFTKDRAPGYITMQVKNVRG
ncbi:MAG: RusA family crossover junction endodeoxyribonuclease [Gammaproteobacteria bacterium]|nr:RusA family crossover junction endodeoxyribonuclease [Gammaproteobacteria bacterium]